MSHLTLARCRLAGMWSLISLSVALAGACKDLAKLNFDCNFLNPPKTAQRGSREGFGHGRRASDIPSVRGQHNCETTALKSGVAWRVQDTTIATLTANSSGGGATVTGLRPGYIRVAARWSSLSATADFFVY